VKTAGRSIADFGERAFETAIEAGNWTKNLAKDFWGRIKKKLGSKAEPDVPVKESDGVVKEAEEKIAKPKDTRNRQQSRRQRILSKY
jgi:hypothetical protein